MGKRKNRHRNKNVIDVVNQDLEKRDPDIKVGEEIATRETSIDFFGTVMGSLPNPDPVLEKLGRTIEVYEDLLYDSRVKAVTESRKSAVLSMKWEIVGEDTPDEEKQVYTDLFNTYPMIDTISEMLDAPLMGYKPMEIVWASVNGKIIPLHFIGKPSRWFGYDDENRLRYFSAANNSDGVLVPEEKFIVVRKNPTYDNPYGKGALSSCFWPVTFRRSGLKFWTVFIEKYGMPFLTANAPGGTKEKELCETADMLANMVTDAIAVVPENYNLEIKEAVAGKGASDSLHKVYLDFMNIEIAMSIVGTNLTTEVQGGSQAAAKSHMVVRQDIIESDQKLIQDSFNELIRRTHVLNYSSTPPKFRLFAEEDIDKTLAERDKILTETGVKFTKEYYMDKYNLEENEFELNNNQGEEEDDDVQ